jgi:hypothetical protein
LLEPFQNYSDEQIEEYQWHKQVESHEEYYPRDWRAARVGLIAILDVVIILEVVIAALEEDRALSHGVHHDRIPGLSCRAPE